MARLKTIKLYAGDHRLLTEYRHIKDLRYMGGCLYLRNLYHMIMRIERIEYSYFTIEEENNGKRNDSV